MTIVASNSITVSNVNDGTITHTAYAYSADGTDRFSTVYPNLNLLTNSRLQSGNITPFVTVNNAVLTINPNFKGLNVSCSGGAISYQQGMGVGGIPVSAGNQYTISVKVINTGTVAIDKFQLQFGFRNSTGTSLAYPNKIFSIPADGKVYSLSFTYTAPDNTTEMRYYCLDIATLANVAHTFTIYDMKAEQGSTATHWMPSASEVTTADWPSYIGQYSDFTSTASTDPTKYAPWTVFKGIDGNNGKDGIGIKTTDITYAISTSGTTAPTSGWTSSIPSPVNGQYFWTKTVMTYTDNSSKTGYSVTYISKDGINGNNGDPGKIVSDTEPTTRFKGLTWKYSGASDLTASDGTIILSGTEYYWSGTNWILSEINAHNINGNNLTITDGEFSSTTINGQVTTSTEIKDNHIAISKTDGTVNTRNDIALDSEQGLAQKFTNIGTGFYRTAGINYQGPFTSDSDGNYAQLTPQGTKLSTDIPWTKLSLMNNFTGNIEYAVINGTVYISAAGVGVPAMTAGQWKQAAQLPTGSSAIPVRSNRIAAGDSGDGLSWALLSNQAGGIFIRCSANKAATANLFNATLPYPIG